MIIDAVERWFAIGYVQALTTVLISIFFVATITKRLFGDSSFWHLADNPTAPAFVRYWSNNGQVRAAALTSAAIKECHV